MTASAKPRVDIAARKPLTYRGIQLQTPFARSQFTPEQIREAVEHAIAENADAIARIRDEPADDSTGGAGRPG
jgi:hypothetical protein